MEIEKVKIDKIGLVFFIVGIIVCLVGSLMFLTHNPTSSDDRLNPVAWILLALAGYFMVEKFSLIYNEKRKKKTKKRFRMDEKVFKKLARNFGLVILLAHLLVIATGVCLLSTNISNLMFLLIYPIVSIGVSTFVISIGIILFLHKNQYSIKKIIKKLKNEK